MGRAVGRPKGPNTRRMVENGHERSRRSQLSLLELLECEGEIFDIHDLRGTVED